MNKVPVEIFSSSDSAIAKLGAETAALILRNDAKGQPTVLGLATGNTPILFYQELIRLHEEHGLSFANVITFNLDEYAGLPPEHPESYWKFMHTHLFDHIDIKEENIHIPSGTVAEEDIAAHCAEYEQAIIDAGGIDQQILGIGRTGHIGFNEPGSPKDSVTRAIQLDAITREDAAPAFGGIDQVPTAAITMGCGTILSARRLVLMAWGEKKAEIVRQAVQGPVCDQVSASFLQEHDNAVFYLDEAAASALRMPSQV
ncbi:glucosamine-6-phosphate deaminase [Verrucomicrobiaceae bacterium 5K15]|uniref:Glucosamine-6-phosphate deaminase n=1 Tax=Oceaniferula flava TaxID=2800421 RepID=A0AAE2SDC1_9BACT|nr:glucosamine-6-phosphate deaminase [Oceaniferula flavus]MBK1856156.1 glucosamine-6-phosphate deaminase [Oceaniferula flavus]MBM1137463.1 glucosamine-6-phosphate deaminase [Oceaniferula flavus]